MANALTSGWGLGNAVPKLPVPQAGCDLTSAQPLPETTSPSGDSLNWEVLADPPARPTTIRMLSFVDGGYRLPEIIDDPRD